MKCLFPVLCLMILIAVSPRALADVQGFGRISRDKVNVHEGMDGPTIYQLNEGHVVYVLSSKVDKEDRVWLRFITQRKQGGSLAVRRGWVLQDAIDLSGAVYTDIAAVSAGESGFLALRRNGTVTGAARVTKWTTDFYNTIESWENVTQVLAGPDTFACVTASGKAEVFGEYTRDIRQGNSKVRLATQGERRTLLFTDGEYVSDRELEWVYPRDGADLSAAVKAVQKQNCLFALMRNGTVACLDAGDDRYMIWNEPRPDFSAWKDIVDIDTVLWHPDDIYYYEVFAAVRADGTVTISPRRVELLTDGWEGIVKIGLGGSYVVGIRRDGTAVAAGRIERIVEDVKEWTGVVAVSCADTYCVGLRANGTLVFAGEFEYDR